MLKLRFAKDSYQCKGKTLVFGLSMDLGKLECWQQGYI